MKEIKKTKKIRFVVGEEGKQISPVWTIWSNKDDVYLTSKYIGAYIKISLHGSGVWILAATAESGKEMIPGNRRLTSWKRPLPFIDGCTWGPNIVVPYDSKSNLKTENPLINWITPPQMSEKVTIMVFFADKVLGTNTLSALPPNLKSYDFYLELKNGERVFILFKYERLTKEDYFHINYINKETVGFKDTEGFFEGYVMNFLNQAQVPYIYTLGMNNSYRDISNS